MKLFCYNLPFIFVFLFYSKSSAQDTIYWNSNYKLHWSDFQAKVDSNSLMKAASSLQVNYIIIPLETKYQWKIKTYFLKSTSWSIGNSDNLLKHEQGHFDIAELFSRKISKAFLNYKKQKIDIRELEVIFDSLMDQYDKITVQYDKETNFSLNSAKQNFWLNKIGLEIKSLRFYRQKEGYLLK